MLSSSDLNNHAVTGVFNYDLPRNEREEIKNKTSEFKANFDFLLQDFVTLKQNYKEGAN